MDQHTKPTLREGLPPLPDKMKLLPLDPRGYPTPWFVAEVNGKRDFRIADANKRVQAVKQKLCWICGGKLGSFLAFPIGPMCAVNRNTSEPPCHRECAEFAATACPFMCLPEAQYRRAGLPEDFNFQPGAIPGNPGAVCLWITKSYSVYRIPGYRDKWLIDIGPPVEVQWYARGRLATRAEILESFDKRLPALERIAEMEGPAAMRALVEQVARAMLLLPAP